MTQENLVSEEGIGRASPCGSLSPSRTERLERLAANAQAGQWSAQADLDWDLGARLPLWMTRGRARAAISQLHHGEVATSQVCLTLMQGEPDPLVRRCLAFQVADERRHAEVFRRYLQPLGGLSPIDPALAWALEAARQAPAGPLGTMVAYHIVVEGEVLRVQDTLTRVFPCPLFRSICRLVARDEARHVAFGRLYLSHRISCLPAVGRSELYRWVHDLWRRASGMALGDRGRAAHLREGLRRWLGGGWPHHQATLRQIGLDPVLEQATVS